MAHPQQIVVGREAIPQLVAYCAELGAGRFTVVSDANTHRALGERIERALREAGLTVTSIVLQGPEVIADEKYLMRTLVEAPPEPQVFIAAGSGTITDIARYVSFRTGNPFISAPSAASVDGFLSLGAPLVVGGIKDTLRAQGPIALFADLPTLVGAPRALTAAGFGDLLGKTTSLADWRLGHLLWGEPYDGAIDGRTRQALNRCMEAAEDIASGSEEGVRFLIEGLIESGLCMLDFGDSRPASGAEHHLSHYWEMTLLREGRPAIFHGAKVSVAAALVSQLFDRVRQLSQAEVRALVERAPFAGHERELAEIHEGFGDGADQILKIQTPFLALSATEYEQIQQRIVERWADIQEIAATVLPAATVRGLLETVGAPTTVQALGFEPRMVETALHYAPYIRNRFTVLKLFHFLGLDPAPQV